MNHEKEKTEEHKFLDNAITRLDNCLSNIDKRQNLSLEFKLEHMRADIRLVKQMLKIYRKKV